ASGEGRRVCQRGERLEPRVTVEPRRRQEVVDDPDVDPVFLALENRVANLGHVLPHPFWGCGGVRPRVGRDPRAEPELGHLSSSFRTGGTEVWRVVRRASSPNRAPKAFLPPAPR